MITTPRFEIFSGSLHIGWSELELGDAPMGVAFGRFLPGPGYAEIQKTVVAAAGGPLPDDLKLSVREKAGQPLEAIDVHLVDCSAEFGAEGLEVSIIGVAYPRYEEVFPQHVAAYGKLFR